ncbi:hypothetical protein [Streptomyces boncukensis]|uniref:Uncharacterized protein n=1 Tax=Streptomyces boncukensis TaxID=2711219 RepID=A0A6G4WWQ1_9ACTN|nr:hypothetical protein [Streptomyces boncukensis]
MNQEERDVWDDKLASAELVSARANITQPSEVAQYVKTFETLGSMAVYGEDARKLIVEAAEAVRE